MNKFTVTAGLRTPETGDKPHSIGGGLPKNPRRNAPQGIYSGGMNSHQITRHTDRHSGPRLTLVSSASPTADQAHRAAARTLVERLKRHCRLNMATDMARDFHERCGQFREGQDAWLSDAQLLAQWLELYQPEAGLQLLALGDEPLDDGQHRVTLSLLLDEGGDMAHALRLEGVGEDAAQACANALMLGMDWDWDISQVRLSQIGDGPDAEHVVMVSSQWEGHMAERWGAGLHADPLMATAMAVLHSALAWPQANALGDLPSAMAMPIGGVIGEVAPDPAHSARIIAWPGRHASR